MPDDAAPGNAWPAAPSPGNAWPAAPSPGNAWPAAPSPGNAWAAAPSSTPVPNYYTADQNYYTGDQPKPGTNGFAIAAFVIGLIGVPVLGAILGIRALSKIRRQPQRGKGLAIAGISLSVVWVAVYVGVIVDNVQTASQRSATTGQITKGGHLDALSLRLGDCFQNPSGATPAKGTVTEVTAVACTTPHDAQVIGVLPVSGSAYPGEAAFSKQADPGCNAAVKTNTDQAKLTSTMNLLWLYPEQDAWDGGQHTISCVIVDSSTDLTSSLMK